MFENYINYVHPTFSLNGEKLDVLGLKIKAKTLVLSPNSFEKKLGELIFEWFDTNNFTEISTSGTTGTPKKIQISKQAMIASALATSQYFKIYQQAKALHCLPVQYIAGKMMFIRAIILGWDLVYVEPSSEPMKNLSINFDFVAMVPLQVENSINKLHLIKNIIIGGAKINSNLREQLLNASTNVYETYGMTETVTHIATKLVSETNFKALPNVFFKVDHRDCLVIHAPHVTDEIVVTNDIVELINEFEFVWKGRADNVINTGGVKIFPEKVEEKLDFYIKSRFFVAGIPDQRLGFKLILVVEGDYVDYNFATIKELSKFEIPKEIYFIKKFLETETAKIKRAEMIKLLTL